MAKSPDRLAAAEPAPPPLTPFSEKELLEKWAGATEPVVSILCVTYNHAPFIRAALDGMLGQDTDFPFEVLVRDDASKDGTADIVREYASRYPRVMRTVLELTNTYSRGVKPTAALMPLVRGEFVAIGQGDDYWINSRKLSEQLRALKANRGAVLCFHDVIAVKDGEVVPEAYRLPASLPPAIPSRAFFPPPGWFPLPVTWLFRRSCCDPGAPEASTILNVDNLMLSQLARAGGAVRLKGAHAVYRVHVGGIYSTLEGRLKRLHLINSYLCICRYHARTGSWSFAVRSATFALHTMLAELRQYGTAVCCCIMAALLRTIVVRTILPSRRLRRRLGIA